MSERESTTVFGFSVKIENDAEKSAHFQPSTTFNNTERKNFLVAQNK